MGKIDTHIKVNEGQSKIRVPAVTAARIFQLTEELDHMNEGQTIEWLLREAEPHIKLVTGAGSRPVVQITSTGSLPVSEAPHSLSAPLTISSTSFPPLVPLPPPGPAMVQAPMFSFAPPLQPYTVPSQGVGQPEYNMVHPDMQDPPMIGSALVTAAPMPPPASDMVQPAVAGLPPFPEQLGFYNPGYFYSLLMDGEDDQNNPE